MTMTTSRLNAAVDYGIKVGRAERAKAHDGQPGTLAIRPAPSRSIERPGASC